MPKAEYLLTYQGLVQEQMHKQARFKADRFVNIRDRSDTCEIPSSAWPPIIKGSYLQHWKDIAIQKGITEMVLYPMLVHELQPKTIIELGAFNGGSAVWLADHLELFGIQGRIYSVDIELSFLDEKARSDERISFLEGDCNNISAVFTPEMLSSFKHPWLFIDDAHVNVVGVLEYFHHNGLQTGDYVIIEDTNQFCWDYWTTCWGDKDNTDVMKAEKGENLTDFFVKHQYEYRVDTHYQDMFGYNGSKCWNSILKRV